MKKQIFLSTGQLIFLVICMSIISILTFLFGIEVGKFLNSSEQNLKNSPVSEIKSSVTISLENYSAVLKKEKERLPEQTAQPEESGKKTEQSTKKEDWLIQVGAYKEKASYLAMEKRLRALGFSTKLVEGKLTRLFVVVKEEEKPEDILKRLEKEGIKGIIVKK
ncbi:MAG: hypothetical protein OHK0040_11810 [bacterium]